MGHDQSNIILINLEQLLKNCLVIKKFGNIKKNTFKINKYFFLFLFPQVYK